jgi:hypothetical protein
LAFHDREYDAFVIVAASEGQPPWSAPAWKKLADVLEPFVEASGHPAAVRTSQLAGKLGEMKPVRFGKIGWNTAGHAKWTHAGANERFFQSVEIWAPSWAQCSARDLAPDLYVCVCNPAAAAAPHVPPVLLLAIACDLRLDATPAAKSIADILGSTLRARSRTPWGTPASGGFTRALQDLLPFGAFSSSWTEDDAAPSFVEPWTAF